MIDWDKPVGITTPRVGAPNPKQADGFASSWDTKGMPYTTVDAGQRTESDGNPSIWSAYDEGY